MRLGIISIYPFPHGMAASNRIFAYCKGLVENDVHVDVFITVPTNPNYCSPGNTNFGDYQGINYFYSIGKFRSRYKLIRAIAILSGYRKIFGIINTCFAIQKKSKINKYDCIIISTDQILPLFCYSFLSKIIKSKSVFIFDEFPVPIRHKLKNCIPKWKHYAYSKILNQISAYISISNELSAYYNNISVKETLILPVITEVSRFNGIIKKTNFVEYICYMGNMELSKDNVDLIIQAFKIVSLKYPNLLFFLYGTPNEKSLKKIQILVNTLELEDKIFFKGKVSYEEVPEILINARILVSSQPDTIRASGGFPTKLGEYLASGTPSLLTDVGENTKYIKENQHAFFVKPNNIKEYADKIIYILENYDFASTIAQTGKKFIIDNFSQTAMGGQLKDFLVNLK